MSIKKSIRLDKIEAVLDVLIQNATPPVTPQALDPQRFEQK
jgi:hypothetical protein